MTVPVAVWRATRSPKVVSAQGINPFGKALQRMIGIQRLPQPWGADFSRARISADEGSLQTRAELLQLAGRVQVQFTADALHAHVRRYFQVVASVARGTLLAQSHDPHIGDFRLGRVGGRRELVPARASCQNRSRDTGRRP
jgi:hypothetical protein